MRVITIEDHFKTQAIWDANRHGDFVQGLAGRFGTQHETLERRLDDLGSERMAAMDAAGIDLQVVSHTTPATETLDPGTAVELAREANDRLADAVAARPERLAGFATLPTPDPEAAAGELERAVQTLGFRGALLNGTTQGRFLDDRFFWPIFAAAERFGVPVYLHPTQPPAAVREAYYSGFSDAVNFGLAGAWGWHVETGLHALRLILGGVFDRYPGLQIIIGHMGEAVPFMLDRADSFLTPAAGLPHSVHDYFVEHFYVTTSGMFTSAPLLILLLYWGPTGCCSPSTIRTARTRPAAPFWTGPPSAPRTGRRSLTATRNGCSDSRRERLWPHGLSPCEAGVLLTRESGEQPGRFYDRLGSGSEETLTSYSLDSGPRVLVELPPIVPVDIDGAAGEGTTIGG